MSGAARDDGAADDGPDLGEQPGPDRDLTKEELHQLSGVRQPRSKLYRGMLWLADNLLEVVTVSCALAFTLALLAGWSPPRWVKLGAIAFVIATLFIGRPTGQKAEAWLWDPNWIYIVDVDARAFDAAIFRVPSQRWPEWDVREGGVDWMSPYLMFARKVDLVEQSLEGTARGALSDREMLAYLSFVDEFRRLEEEALRGFAIEKQVWSIVRVATMEAVDTIVDTFERGMLPDRGAGVSKAINDALEQFGLERGSRNLGPIEDTPGGEDSSIDFEEVTDALEVDLDGERITPDGGSADD